MEHHIIVKYNDTVIDKEELLQRIRAHFADVTAIEGVSGVEFHTSVIDRPNRYDLMIVIEMEKESLPLFDASDVHNLWKENFSKYIVQKAIFDCD